ncbi:hypothetical protein DQ04_00591030 [Trypanosoma grayi]|uniref:hypothetical protein n=1 Tax=Trypanosoma grayi TaxID=71804 RepID=UPI0004F44F14|nr:hypothetical protein DQ04_00591030 [Trypanosoma grayi]KEG14162.1 hypothetical protein DQ04_00591030 [Trypanosoma grayi]
MRRWCGVAKRPLLRRKAVERLSPRSLVAPEECLIFERELLEGAKQFFRTRDVSLLRLSHSFYPFTVFALQACALSPSSAEIMWPLLLLALHTTDTSMHSVETCLFGGTSVMRCHCMRLALDLFKTSLLSSSSPCCTEDFACMRLVVSILDSPLSTIKVNTDGYDLTVVAELNNFKHPIPCHILQLILSKTATPSLLSRIVSRELEKYDREGVGEEFFSACLNGLLANDCFFSLFHFHEMDTILTSIMDKIGPSFDYLSIRWTPILNKVSRIYMRQCQGEALSRLHFKLLRAIPALETKLPLSYLVRCIGSLVDVGMIREDASDVWLTITGMASISIRLYGSVWSSLHSIWILLLKAALTLTPHCLDYARLIEAYHVCASLGHPIVLDKAAFSQVVRFLINTIRFLSLTEMSTAVCNFYRFLREHPSISFLWVTDSLLGVLSEIWRFYGEDASPVVQRFIKDLQEDYFPSLRLSGVRLEDNPAIRRLLEDFNVVKKSDFWWRCGCGTELPASAKRCLTCLRRHNVSWTCVTCGAEHASTGVDSVCACGSENPRTSEANRSGVRLCRDCSDVLTLLGDCAKCENAARQQKAKRQCSFCGNLYSQRDVCCPVCYAANEDKKPMLWRCDSCEEYNQWTWSKCQRCLGRRRVGCIVTPMEPWVCGCGRRNHSCRTGCETCSRDHSVGAYRCDLCGGISTQHKTLYFSLHSTPLRCIACQNCSNIHPRDRNVVRSPFLQRHCHRCGSKYTFANLPFKGHCTFCHAFLCYNELCPFVCNNCKFSSPQIGFHCSSCQAPRADIMNDDVFVWRCHREVVDSMTSSDTHVCGQWNYSWSNCCTSCGEARAQSKHECRARFLPWVCSHCRHQNLPTDVLLCPRCDSGLQDAPSCSICGLPHLSVNCASNIIVRRS